MTLVLALLLDPLGQPQSELGWLENAPWAKLGLAITVAVMVLTVGTTMARRRPRRRANRRPSFDLDVARLDQQPVTTIAQARDGAVHIEGVLASSVGNLGGSPGRERVWHNRARADRSSAVASELVLVRDESGQTAIEGLDRARVIAAIDHAPAERPKAHDTVSLYLGDRVQVLGHFRAESHGDDEDPTDRVYGIMGTQGHVQVRVLHRPDPEGDPLPEAENDAPVESPDAPP
jgi:hypothetical protein